MELNNIDRELLSSIADLHKIPEGAFNIRKDGKLLARNISANIEALSNGEGYVLACANQPDIMCYIKCSKCGAVWSAKYSSVPRIAYIGDCNCGKK